MFAERIGKIADKLVLPFIDDCEKDVAEMIKEYIKQNKELPTLMTCVEEIELYNTQVIDEMVCWYMSNGEGYIHCAGPSNIFDDCGCCDQYSACYNSILNGNIIPFHREAFDDISTINLVFGALRYTSSVLVIDDISHKLYDDFVDCFDSDNRLILDTLFFKGADDVVYANHAQTTMFDDLFMDAPGSVFRFGSCAAVIYDSFGHRYNSFYIEEEEQHGITGTV